MALLLFFLSKSEPIINKKLSSEPLDCPAALHFFAQPGLGEKFRLYKPLGGPYQVYFTPVWMCLALHFPEQSGPGEKFRWCRTHRLPWPTSSLLDT